MLSRVHLLFLVAGVLIGSGGKYLLSWGASNSPMKPKEHMSLSRRTVTRQAGFVLLVSVRCTSNTQKQAFLELFGPMAEYVLQNEVDTLSYAIGESDKIEHELEMIIIERYTSKEAYLKHKESSTFLEFRSKLHDLQNQGLTLDGHSYLQTRIGFV